MFADDINWFIVPTNTHYQGKGTVPENGGESLGRIA